MKAKAWTVNHTLENDNWVFSLIQVQVSCQSVLLGSSVNSEFLPSWAQVPFDEMKIYSWRMWERVYKW